MADEVKFAETVVEVESEVVAKITSFNRNVSISEEDVTGAEDVVAGTDILHSQFVSIAKGETADVAGIAIESATTGLDAGQSELRDAAENGEVITMTHTKANGYGRTLTGFFTSYTESGSIGSVYKFSGTFRVNTNVPIEPGS
jgi:hypothetical protein